MKYLSVLGIALLMAANAPAQTKNPASSKEMQDKIKEVQQLLNNLTPEQKKMMKADWDAFQNQVNEKNIQRAKELVPYQQAAAQKA